LHRSAAHSEEKKRKRKGSERKREKEAERSISVEKRTLDTWMGKRTNGCSSNNFAASRSRVIDASFSKRFTAQPIFA